MHGLREHDREPAGTSPIHRSSRLILTRLRHTVLRIPPRWRKGLVVLIGCAIGAVALLFSAQGVDRAGLASAFGGVTWWWVAAAATANMINIAAQGWAWRIGLEAGGTGPVATRHAIAATWVGKAGNQLLPGKVGEIARVAMIRTHLDHERREISRIVGTLVAQRVFNLVATLAIIAVTASVMPLPVDIPGGRWGPLMVFTTLAVVIVAVAVIKPFGRLRGSGTGRVRAMARTFAGGAGLLRPNRAALAALGFHVIGVAAQLTMLQCLLRGFSVEISPTAPLLIITLVAIVGAVPGAPGGAGLNQAALVAPLGAAYGVSANSAFAFAIGMQATVAVVAAVGGLVAMVHHRHHGRMRAAFS